MEIQKSPLSCKKGKKNNQWIFKKIKFQIKIKFLKKFKRKIIIIFLNKILIILSYYRKNNKRYKIIYNLSLNNIYHKFLNNKNNN